MLNLVEITEEYVQRGEFENKTVWKFKYSNISKFKSLKARIYKNLN